MGGVVYSRPPLRVIPEGPARVAQLVEAAVSNAACSGFESQYGYYVPVVELGIHASLRG